MGSCPRAVPDISFSNPSVSFSSFQDVGPDLFQCPQRLGLIEVAGEADLLAGLDASRIIPGSRCLGQHHAVREALDAAARPIGAGRLVGGVGFGNRTHYDLSRSPIRIQHSVPLKVIQVPHLRDELFLSTIARVPNLNNSGPTAQATCCSGCVIADCN